jgi:hypothetical protein
MGNLNNKKARPWDILNKNIELLENTLALERFEICKACPELIQMTNQCKKCKCFMNLKTKLPHAECPLGKWSRAEVNYKGEIK